MLADERMRTSEPPPSLINLSQQKENGVTQESIEEVITTGNNDNDDHDIDTMNHMNDDMTIINESHDSNMNNTILVLTTLIIRMRLSMIMT